MINLDGISAAAEKAIAAGGTNNAILGNSLVKRGVMAKAEPTSGSAWKFVLSAEFMRFQDAMTEGPAEIEPAPYNEHSEARAAEESDTINGGPETVSDAEREFERAKRDHEAYNPDLGTREEYEEEMARAKRDHEIERLRAEFPNADTERKVGIVNRLAALGTVVYPEGTPEYEDYRTKLRAELKAWAAQKPEEKREQLNVEQLSVYADEVHSILNPEPVRDPEATRYEDIPKWTDDRLVQKYKELHAKLLRHHLRGYDRKLSENRCQRIENEIQKRGIQDRLR